MTRTSREVGREENSISAFAPRAACGLRALATRIFLEHRVSRTDRQKATRQTVVPAKFLWTGDQRFVSNA